MVSFIYCGLVPVSQIYLNLALLVPLTIYSLKLGLGSTNDFGIIT